MRALLLIACFGLAACVTPCPPSATPPAPVTKSFLCSTGETLTVTFSYAPDQAVVREPGQPDVTLRAAVAGSGFRYMAGNKELRGRGDEIRFIRPGAGERVCQAQD